MSQSALQKKKNVDDIVRNALLRLSALKKKRDSIVSGFLDVLKKKKVQQIRDSLV